MRRAGWWGALAVVACSTGAFAQAQDAAMPSPSYALARGKVEFALGGGFHMTEWQGTDLEGVPNVHWDTGGDALIGAGLGVGLTRRFSTQFEFSFSRHENDMYWRPELPHDPYLATANLLTFSAGIRWDIRHPRFRVRPYAGGGIVAARFLSIERGPSEWCPTAIGIAPGSCFQMAPELFTGTRATGYFDAGVNFVASRRWGVRSGMKLFLLEGSGTAPAIPADKPIGTDTFWHSEVTVLLVFRPQ